MAGQERIFEISQAGLETTRGTAVAATRKLYTNWSPFSYEKEIVFANAQTGTLEPNIDATYRRPSPVGHTGAEQATFEDLPWWLQAALKGGVTGGAGDAGSPPMYTYAFNPSNTADDIKSFTLERGTTTLPYKFNQAMVNQLTIRIDPDNEAAWMLDIEAMSRKPAQTAMTGAISDRTRELIRAPGTQLFVDTTTIGTTQVSGRFIGGSVTIQNSLNFKAFSEDEDDYAANKVGRGMRLVTAQFSFEHDSDTEFANYRDATAGAPLKRKIRVKRIGSVIHDAVTKDVTLDVYGYWSAAAMDYRENNKIITLTLAGARDATATATIIATVKNALATLP